MLAHAVTLRLELRVQGPVACRRDSAYRPEVVHKQVEDAQQDHQQDGAQLRLESYHNHNAGDQADQADHDSPKTPGSGKDEADEEEHQENPSTKLYIHLPV